MRYLHKKKRRSVIQGILYYLNILLCNISEYFKYLVFRELHIVRRLHKFQITNYTVIICTIYILYISPQLPRIRFDNRMYLTHTLDMKQSFTIPTYQFHPQTTLSIVHIRHSITRFAYTMTKRLYQSRAFCIVQLSFSTLLSFSVCVYI